MKRLFIVPTLALSLCLPVIAQTARPGFTAGPVLKDFGPIAKVDTDQKIPDGMALKVAFDISEASEGDELNRKFESVARFINLNAAAGVSREQIKPAIVVHGPAAAQLVEPASEAEETKTTDLIRALLEEGVPIYLCGQTAAARSISKDELIPGVQMSYSAMTAHAILAREGYSLNPF